MCSVCLELADGSQSQCGRCCNPWGTGWVLANHTLIVYLECFYPIPDSVPKQHPAVGVISCTLEFRGAGAL